MAKVNLMFIICRSATSHFQLDRVILNKSVLLFGQIMGLLGFRNFGGGVNGSNLGSDGSPECVLSASTPHSRRVFSFNFLFRYGHTFWRFTGLFSSYRYGKHEINCAPVTLLKKVFFQPCFY